VPFLMHWWLCWSQSAPELPQLLFSIKSCFKGCLLNFMCTLCVGSNLVS
jgi:hypothetical protein